MNLKKYYGKEVIIQTSNGLPLIGIVNDYLFPEDSDQKSESIILETYSGDLIELTENDITSISITQNAEP